MKGKYITLQILLACLPKPVNDVKDIHAQLEETIAERKSILERLRQLSQAARVIDIYLADKQAA